MRHLEYRPSIGLQSANPSYRAGKTGASLLKLLKEAWFFGSTEAYLFPEYKNLQYFAPPPMILICLFLTAVLIFSTFMSNTPTQVLVLVAMFALSWGVVEVVRAKQLGTKSVCPFCCFSKCSA